MLTHIEENKVKAVLYEVSKAWLPDKSDAEKIKALRKGSAELANLADDFEIGRK